MYERQEELVQTIRENQVVLVLGETGSGKTTQVRAVSDTFISSDSRTFLSAEALAEC